MVARPCSYACVLLVLIAACDLGNHVAADVESDGIACLVFKSFQLRLPWGRGRLFARRVLRPADRKTGDGSEKQKDTGGEGTTRHGKSC